MSKQSKTNFLAECILGDLQRCKNENDYKSAVKKMAKELIEHGNKLEDELALMTAGREQDKSELKICAAALDRIATSNGAWDAEMMSKEAVKALADIGAWNMCPANDKLRDAAQ